MPIWAEINVVDLGQTNILVSSVPGLSFRVGNRMALASRKDLMRILTQPAQRKGLHHNLTDLLIDPLDSMHLLNEKMHEKVL